MMLKTLVMCVAVLALHASASEALPAEVRNFIDDREGCDHMRGEVPDPPDKQRMKELKREMDKLCKGTDRKLAQLKRRYVANRGVMQRLNELEPQIEASKLQKPARH
jgi:hypothetical protein